MARTRGYFRSHATSSIVIFYVTFANRRSGKALVLSSHYANRAPSATSKSKNKSEQLGMHKLKLSRMRLAWAPLDSLWLQERSVYPSI